MKKTDYIINQQEVSYELLEDGYNIYLDEKLWISQNEPHIPYPDLGYEGSCLKQLEDLTSVSEEDSSESDYETRLSALEEENMMLAMTLDDIMTNVIPSLMME